MENPRHYLVELGRPRDGWGDLEKTASRARAAARNLARAGTSVSFLRLIFVPEDDSCFLLYSAPDAASAASACEAALLDLTSVDEVIDGSPRLDAKEGVEAS